MQLGIDLDGCVYDFGRSFRDYLADQGIYDLPESTCWEMWNDWGMTMQEWLDHFSAGVAAGVIFRVGKPIPGSKPALDFLRSEGHTLHIVTHRDIHPRCIQSTVEWLTEHEIPYDTITFAKDKTIIPVDAFIEDNVDNALALEAEGTRVALLDRPWNRHGEETDCIFRAADWSDFVDAVTGDNPDAWA